MRREVRNILVTGGAGFIGSAFVRYILEKKSHLGSVVVLDLLTYAGNRENLATVSGRENYHFVKGDIQDRALVEGLIDRFKIDTIVHFAAESHVDRSILGPAAFVETNIMGTFQLLEAVRAKSGIHFHHVSTDEVYGCLGETGHFTEETAYRPNSPYAASKAASDHLVRAYHKTYGISTVISNCSNNYGPYQFPEKLIPLMIMNCFEGKALPVYGEGKNVRDWLFVDDHAEAIFLLLTQGRSGETYNIGGNQEVRNIDLVHKIIDLVSEIANIDKKKLLSQITYVKDRPGHDYRYAIDATKIADEIGFVPSPSLMEKLKETILWYRDHASWIDHIRTGAYIAWIDQNYQSR